MSTDTPKKTFLTHRKDFYFKNVNLISISVMRFITLINNRNSGGFEREPGFPSNSEYLKGCGEVALFFRRRGSSN
jgi:hypothetical protein